MVSRIGDGPRWNQPQSEVKGAGNGSPRNRAQIFWGSVLMSKKIVAPSVSGWGSAPVKPARCAAPSMPRRA